MQLLQNRTQIATFITLLFHVSGFIAIAFFHSALFIRLTPLNLLVSLALILWTQERINGGFLLFAVLTAVIGFGAEWVGVNTAKLFGRYSYGDVLGLKWKGVPLLIGVNWFITLYCIGISMSMLHKRLISRQPGAVSAFGARWMDISLIIDGAALAVFFDWVIEPVAIRLGFWSWTDGDIPSFNYWSWFAVSMLILLLYRLLRFDKHNLFAVHLLLIQTMFFLLLRTMS